MLVWNQSSLAIKSHGFSTIVFPGSSNLNTWAAAVGVLAKLLISLSEMTVEFTHMLGEHKFCKKQYIWKVNHTLRVIVNILEPRDAPTKRRRFSSFSFGSWMRTHELNGASQAEAVCRRRRSDDISIGEHSISTKPFSHLPSVTDLLHLLSRGHNSGKTCIRTDAANHAQTASRYLLSDDTSNWSELIPKHNQEWKTRGWNFPCHDFERSLGHLTELDDTLLGSVKKSYKHHYSKRKCITSITHEFQYGYRRTDSIDEPEAKESERPERGAFRVSPPGRTTGNTEEH